MKIIENVGFPADARIEISSREIEKAKAAMKAARVKQATRDVVDSTKIEEVASDERDS